MHRTYRKFALRAALNASKPRRLAGVGVSLFAIALCSGLSGCAESLSYPTLSNITDVGNILTPEQRQKTVQDLQKDAAATNDVKQNQ